MEKIQIKPLVFACLGIVVASFSYTQNANAQRVEAPAQQQRVVVTPKNAPLLRDLELLLHREQIEYKAMTPEEKIRFMERQTGARTTMETATPEERMMLIVETDDAFEDYSARTDAYFEEGRRLVREHQAANK